MKIGKRYTVSRDSEMPEIFTALDIKHAVGVVLLMSMSVHGRTAVVREKEDEMGTFYEIENAHHTWIVRRIP